MIMGKSPAIKKMGIEYKLTNQHADDFAEAEIESVRGGNGEEIIIDPARAVEPEECHTRIASDRDQRKALA